MLTDYIYRNVTRDAGEKDPGGHNCLSGCKLLPGPRVSLHFTASLIPRTTSPRHPVEYPVSIIKYPVKTII